MNLTLFENRYLHKKQTTRSDKQVHLSLFGCKPTFKRNILLFNLNFTELPYQTKAQNKLPSRFTLQ